MRNSFLRAALMATCVLAAACAPQQLLRGPQNARREPHIQSLTPSFKPAKYKSAAVFNFKLMDGYKGEGPALADYSAEQLVTRGIVEDAKRVDEFVSDPTQAARLARREMKQLAVIGSIDEYIYGGLSTESRVAMTYTVVEAATGRVIVTLRGVHSESPNRPKEKFFYVDQGGPAPLPMQVAQRLVQGLTGELAVKPKLPEPKPVAPEPPKPPEPSKGLRSAHDSPGYFKPEEPAAPVQAPTPAAAPAAVSAEAPAQQSPAYAPASDQPPAPAPYQTPEAPAGR